MENTHGEEENCRNSQHQTPKSVLHEVRWPTRSHARLQGATASYGSPGPFESCLLDKNWGVMLLIAKQKYNMCVCTLILLCVGSSSHLQRVDRDPALQRRNSEITGSNLWEPPDAGGQVYS